MNIIWARSLVSLVLLAVLCVLVGVFVSTKAALTLAVLALLAQGIFSTFHKQRLWRLLDAPVYGEVPSAPGIWGEIYYRLHKLAKRWHAQVRQVEQQHSRFIQAIQASPNGVAMLDDHDQIEWCNAISEQHFGLDAKRDLRQHITHLVRHPDFVRYLNSHRYEEMLIMRGMGDKRQNVISVQVFPYGENRKLVLSQDITELERTDAMRRDFVANVSHELKTPLTVLSGFLETMRELPLDESERVRYLDLMMQQAQRMQHIVSDLLVLATLEGDNKPPSSQMVDMRAVLRHLRDDAQSLSGGRHRVTFDADEALTVTGVETEILSAFGNLVTNAIRYTPDGGSISVSWHAQGGQATFAVTDSGLGIPAADIPRLTERFYRVDRSRSRDTGGTGLGLAIVKHVLQRHDAQLDVKSEEGRGSVFTVRFPVARTARLQSTAA
ncbi:MULTISPECIES: phosphate regulon sensor histidine kinase PhoR [Paraburkholderia]|jgi:two-component system phosphate regulon sensor histidine kinase PhoR|uniref:Phosphate regulon sensor protein PhoR n=1 Tax=Paraburkholderia largidicola TaxID=3014751 RepID=A0A7I8BHA6_9BURK|nr:MULTISPECIES: phosphate regulon sensor histidine kinase PhoR [Paraburkholderia]BEU20814.1 phosphate regulon sensor histidine kinase PhoR [Paraburkholderia sp. 22B1P]GJH34680.1 phosphate regulon sensor histidine kinase PhoR [Paraburkholderia hospita]CAG9241924.1 Phosphate regulon sensor protein PhoR [Paraburkholderia caribensis]BCF87895.1 phosphate regulon sensor histidine kinase PhoR [Paraburkholderia sp. PGU16]GJH01868.1 phosphate regulon sensor histidine kinase PhoR [Paraburkholderia terr